MQAQRQGCGGLTWALDAGQLMQWMGSKLGAAAGRLQLPTPAVGRLSISKATLHAHMAGEPIPRLVPAIDASLSLGPEYDSMHLTLSGVAPVSCGGAAALACSRAVF